MLKYWANYLVARYVKWATNNDHIPNYLRGKK
jgi:hypothetical protein